MPRINVERIEQQADGKYTLHCASGVTLSDYDAVIYAIGRRPNIEPLNLEAAGIKVDKNGYIPTDFFQNTNVAGVYAVGIGASTITTFPPWSSAIRPSAPWA